MENWEIAELKKEIDGLRFKIEDVEDKLFVLYEMNKDLYTNILTKFQKSWLLEEEEEGDV